MIPSKTDTWRAIARNVLAGDWNKCRPAFIDPIADGLARQDDPICQDAAKRLRALQAKPRRRP